MRKKRILFISPVIPASGRSGGRQAVYNHLQSLTSEDHNIEIDLLVVDTDNCHESLPPDLQVDQSWIFPREFPAWKAKDGKLAAFRQLLLEARPRAAAMAAAPRARQWLEERLSLVTYDVLVIEHANAWALLDGLNFDIPVTYIAQNVEEDILWDEQRQAGRISPHRPRLLLEWFKTRRFEASLLARASKVICISSFDRHVLASRGVCRSIVTWPELPTIRSAFPRSWAGKRLLFVGSPRHFPNVEAARWLAENLMPQLQALCPEVVLHIAGCSREDVTYAAVSRGVIFEGFVSMKRLDELHRIADLFICPVVLGSGIKIKALEAAAYGLPVVATAESLRGIDFLRDIAITIARDPEQVAQRIADMLVNPSLLQQLSTASFAALERAHAQRPVLGKII